MNPRTRSGKGTPVKGIPNKKYAGRKRNWPGRKATHSGISRPQSKNTVLLPIDRSLPLLLGVQGAHQETPLNVPLLPRAAFPPIDVIDHIITWLERW